MTDKFLRADGFRKQAEAGYAYSPFTDKGGETIFGISRVANPHWLSWLVVDHYTGGVPILTRGGRAVDQARQSTLDKMNADPGLQQKAQELFFASYWEPIAGDALPADVATVLYDAAVNSGPGRAIKILQDTLGVPVDGKLGPGTMTALTHICASGTGPFVAALFSSRLKFYRTLVAMYPMDEADLPGWVNRLKALAKFLNLDPVPPCLSRL